MSDLTIKSEDIISEIADSNPFYSIVVANEIAIRYSIRSPLRGATGPDKPVLAIQKLNDLKQDLNNPTSSEELTGLFDMFARRTLNEGNELIGDYEEDDSYDQHIRNKEQNKEVVFSGEDDFEDDDYDELSDGVNDISEDDDFDDEGTDVPEDDDDLDPSEDDLDEIDNR